MADKRSKDFLVSTADVAFIHNDMLAFTGTTSLNSSISVSMEDQEITGGKLDKLLYKYKYGRRVSLTIEMAEWRLEYIAAQTGSTIFEGLKDVFSIAECVTLTNGVGTLAKTPVDGKVFIERTNHNIEEIEADGNVITLESEDETEIVNATYRYNADVKSVTIDADATPYVGELILSADLHNNLYGKIGEVQIDVPSFQLSGTFDISMESTGNTTTEMDGDALAVDGDTCSDGTVYAYITEIRDAGSASSAITDIAATPAVVELVVGETATITVVGIRGGDYSNVGIDIADCTITSDDASIADVADGVITAVAEGSTMINVEYEGMQDVIKVTVTAN